MNDRFFHPRACWLFAVLAASSCGPSSPNPPGSSTQDAGLAPLARVGTFVLSDADVDYQIREQGGPSTPERREEALQQLIQRARLAQAALDSGLDRAPEVQAEWSRILANHFREKQLFPQLKEAAKPVPQTRLRELYSSRSAAYQSSDQRMAAVLWLNPGNNPERTAQYVAKLEEARAWFLANHKTPSGTDLEEGFSVLAVDHSEHQASRYQGGVAGWFQREGGVDAWSKALAEILYSLQMPGDLSEVISRPEGVFLVRYLAERPGETKPFESVSADLERSEQRRLRDEMESSFLRQLEERYPAERSAAADSTPPAPVPSEVSSPQPSR